MSVPSLRDQRAGDIDRFYDEDLPWVETITAPGLSDPIPARFTYPADDLEGQTVSRDLAWCRVRRCDWPTPAYRDTVTLTAGGAWRVAAVLPAGSLEWRLKLESNVRMGFNL